MQRIIKATGLWDRKTREYAGARAGIGSFPQSEDIKLRTIYETMIQEPGIKLLELINDYSKVAGYKINTQKSLAFLYTNNEKTEREVKETIPFTTEVKIIKYLRINLIKEAKDLEMHIA